MSRGRAFLLKVSEDGKVFNTVAGLRVTAETITPNSLVITGSGVFTGSAAQASVRRIAGDGAPFCFEMSFETGERTRGDFLITEMKYVGDFNGESAYTLTLSSTGKPQYQ